MADRSRLVAKQIKMHNAPELVVTAPPIDSLVYLKRRESQGKTLSTMHVEVTYFCAGASRELSLMVPAEDRQEGERDI